MTPEDNIVREQNRARREGFVAGVVAIATFGSGSIVLHELAASEARASLMSIAALALVVILYLVGMLAVSYALGGNELPSKRKTEDQPMDRAETRLRLVELASRLTVTEVPSFSHALGGMPVSTTRSRTPGEIIEAARALEGYVYEGYIWDEPQ